MREIRPAEVLLGGRRVGGCVQVRWTRRSIAERWQKLSDGKADPDELHQLARQIAFSFVDKHFQSGTYVADYIDLLCEMATFHVEDGAQRHRILGPVRGRCGEALR